MGDRQRIALINAVTGSIAPAKAALRVELPDADIWSLIDDRLLQDADAQGGLTPSLQDRMRRLIEHAMTEGADGVLLTCSLYGPVADTMTSAALPVLSADGAAFDAVADLDGGTIAVVSGQQVPLDDSTARLGAHLHQRDVHVRLLPVLAAGAADAAATGDYSALVDRIVDEVKAAGEVDGVLLAQYSLAPTAELVADRLDRPVITGPGRAAARLAAALSPTGGRA
jgi:hypothetical protein